MWKSTGPLFSGIALVWLSALLFCSAGLAQEVTSPGEIIPVTADFCTEMHKAKVLNAGAPVGCGRLRQVKFSYLNFSQEPQTDGELVVMDAVADRVLRIFDILKQKMFSIAKAQLMDHYLGDDEASMADNNTSAFNDRQIAGGGSISIHAYGLAIDVNPIQNPFIRRSKGERSVSPKSGVEYEDRKNLRPGMAEAIVDIFADNGFPIWGGRWSNPTDYQHFQTSRPLANELARSPPSAAKMLFETSIDEYQKCMQQPEAAKNRKLCVSGPP